MFARSIYEIGRGRKGFFMLKRRVIRFLIAFMIGAGILYVLNMRQSATHLSEASASTPCTSRAATQKERLAPLVKGDIAALTVLSKPIALPHLSLNGPDGKQLNLDAFRDKILLVNIWASWCAPCREELPTLDRLQGKLGGAKFDVLTLNIDSARLEQREAIWKEASIAHLTLYSDKEGTVFSQLRQAGRIMGLPTTYLVNGEGCVLAEMAGPANWASDDALALLRAVVAE